MLVGHKLIVGFYRAPRKSTQLYAGRA